MKEINGEKFYTRRDLATLLGVTVETIANKQKRGEIAAIRLGRTLYTSETALKRFLDGETSSPVKGMERNNPK